MKTTYISHIQQVCETENEAITPSEETTAEQLSYICRNIEFARSLYASHFSFTISTITGDNGHMYLQQKYSRQIKEISKLAKDWGYEIIITPSASQSNQEMFRYPEKSPIIHIVKEKGL